MVEHGQKDNDEKKFKKTKRRMVVKVIPPTSQFLPMPPQNGGVGAIVSRGSLDILRKWRC